MTANVSFDRILITQGDSQRELSIESFLALPLAERVGYILSKQLQFWRGPLLIEPRLALAELRALKKTA